MKEEESTNETKAPAPLFPSLPSPKPKTAREAHIPWAQSSSANQPGRDRHLQEGFTANLAPEPCQGTDYTWGIFKGSQGVFEAAEVTSAQAESTWLGGTLQEDVLLAQPPRSTEGEERT